MKKSRLLAIVFSMVLFASCNDLKLPWKIVPVTKEPPVMNYDITSHSPATYAFLQVIKFKKDEYKNMIVVEREAGTNNWLIRGGAGNWLDDGGPGSMFRIPVPAGTKPYRDLADGYVVVDWRIETVFLYFPVTRLVQMPWSEVKKWDMSWSEESLTFIDDSDPIAENYAISYEWLEWYAGKKETLMPPDSPYPINQTWYPFDIDFSWSFRKEEERFNEYIKTLNSIITTDGLSAVLK